MAGGGSSATVTVEPISKDAASCWGVEAVRAQTQADNPVTTAYAAVLGLIGTVGLIRQWNALDRSLDIAERQVDVAEAYYDLAKQNYDEITVEAYTCQKDLFNVYKTDFEAYGKQFVDFAAANKEYTPDYDLYAGRAAAGVGAQFSRLRQRRSRQRSKYATGLCCNENLQLDVAMAMAMTEHTNRGYRYEDQRRIQIDQWYWARCEAAANFVAQMRANIISGVNSGTANAAQGISAVGGAVGRLNEAAGGQQQSLQNIASFFGTLSNGAFGLAGGVLGYNSTGGGTQFQLPGFGGSAGPQNPSASGTLGDAGGGFLSGFTGGRTTSAGIVGGAGIAAGGAGHNLNTGGFF